MKEGYSVSFRKWSRRSSRSPMASTKSFSNFWFREPTPQSRIRFCMVSSACSVNSLKASNHAGFCSTDRGSPAGRSAKVCAWEWPKTCTKEWHSVEMSLATSAIRMKRSTTWLKPMGIPPAPRPAATIISWNSSKSMTWSWLRSTTAIIASTSPGAGAIFRDCITAASSSGVMVPEQLASNCWKASLHFPCTSGGTAARVAFSCEASWSMASGGGGAEPLCPGGRGAR
mmetsp:Transcript_32942/g.87040  ORF Transcript_32942/g.87040 Transcript_32942/m.87040 type:complete len:228 (+) Transcript_32942:353-1036(+)